MKNLKNLLLAGTVCSMLVFSACTDDTVDPTDGGGSTKTCKVTKTSDDDGDVTYTYDGDNLVKVVESDGYSYDYNYVNGELTEIVEDDGSDTYTYKITYKDGKVSRVDEYFGTDLEGYYNVTWNADGTINMVDEYVALDPTDMLFSSLTYTYEGGRITRIKEISDANDDGELKDADDDVLFYNILVVDDKKNPFYGLPTYLIDFTDMLALTKNNINAASLESEGVTIPIAVTYEYNDDNYPTTSTAFAFGDSTVVNMTYMCD
jgi:hypothetical protein